MSPGLPVTVLKLDEEGVEVFRYSGRILEHSARKIVLEAIFDMEELEFPGLSFRNGDRFVETHYSDRWYNVLAIHDVDTGKLKGWYCNVTRPAVFEDASLGAEDLALDLVVHLDGSWVVMDEDEFEELELSPEDRAQAQMALRELQRYAEELAGPFAVGEDG